MLIQTAVTEPSVEALDKCILSWLARLNEVQLDSGVLTPQEHRLARHFWTIIQD